MSEKNFNELYKELENKVELLEKGELLLEEAVKVYTEGNVIIRMLNEKLDKAREKMTEVDLGTIEEGK
jgi:exodeoxyribonuclease VII small subunit